MFKIYLALIMKYNPISRAYKRETGHIDYSSFNYDMKKAYRNRVFMGKFD
jgi:hypothetical protein